MPISAEHAGRTYPATEPYEVTRGKIAEFAAAIGDPDPAYDGEHAVAPPTFAAVVAAQAWGRLFADPELGLALHRVVHGEQSFVWHRRLHAGDTVVGRLTIDRVRARGLVEMISLTVRLETPDGEPLCDAASTLVHTREAS